MPRPVHGSASADPGREHAPACGSPGRLAVAGAIALSTALVSVAVWGTGSAATPYAFLYLWAGLYAFVALGRRAALAQLGLVGLSAGIAFAAQAGPLTADHVASWLLATVTLAAAGALVGGLAGRARRAHAVARERLLRDPLTGLPNRRHALEHLREQLAGAAPVAVAFVDIDRFKAVNDSLGHAAGDEVMRAVALRASAALAPGEFLACLGADELLLAFAGTDGLAGARVRAQALHERLAAPLAVAGRVWPVDASIGVVVAPPGDRAEEVLRDAGVAMDRAKALGGGRVVPFDARLRREVNERRGLEAALRDALAARRIEVAYQPVVRLPRGEIVGYEALARWTDPDRGPVAPADFIAVAEAAGLIGALGRHVLETACLRLAALDAETGGGRTRMAVNVSVHQLEDPAFVEVVAGALAAAGLEPERLVLELTESVLLRNELASETLEALRAMGVRLALDDFGTGYSALGYLTRLSVDEIKLDRAFVQRVHLEDSAARLAGAMVELARALGLGVVAEGVEEPEQRRVLVALGCPTAQGYLFGRPQSEPQPDEPALAAA